MSDAIGGAEIVFLKHITERRHLASIDYDVIARLVLLKKIVKGRGIYEETGQYTLN